MEKSVQKSAMIYVKKAAMENPILRGCAMGSNMHAMNRVCVFESVMKSEKKKD